MLGAPLVLVGAVFLLHVWTLATAVALATAVNCFCLSCVISLDNSWFLDFNRETSFRSSAMWERALP